MRIWLHTDRWFKVEVPEELDPGSDALTEWLSTYYPDWTEYKE